MDHWERYADHEEISVTDDGMIELLYPRAEVQIRLTPSQAAALAMRLEAAAFEAARA